MHIQLIGGQQVLASDGLAEERLRFYGGLFDRLPRAVTYTGDLTRYVGHQSQVGEGLDLHFLGVEVERIDDIDVMVEIPSFAEGRRRALPLLSREEWEYWWDAGHMVFVKRQKLMGRRTHHLHMAPRGHPLWERLAFRDYLRSHPEEASRYATLKADLAAAYHEDRERYTIAKAEYVRQVTVTALRGL